jgi:hypothetical protein
VDGFEYDCALQVPEARDAVGRPIDLGTIVCVGPLTEAAGSQAARP